MLQVSQKVFIFAWRMLRDKLPTKLKLPTHSVISTQARLCVAGCGHVGDVQHLFLLCSTFASFWQLVRACIGFDGVDTQVISDHFYQFKLHRWPESTSKFSTSLYGFCVLGSCGTREIIDCLKIRIALVISYLKK